MYSFIRPLIFLLDPEIAHYLALSMLRFWMTPKKVAKIRSTLPTKPADCFGLTFPNKIGLAAGLDKNGDYMDALFGLGFSFIEVGTVTPLPQPGNAKPRLYRIPKARALVNQMGFNNLGVDYLVARLKTRKVPGIVGVNIGKNKETPLIDAVKDYTICLEKVAPYADYITINLSSPNTPGLRELQTKAYLETLLMKLNQVRATSARHLPLLLKIAPDLSLEELAELITVCEAANIDGLIIANTSMNHTPIQPYLSKSLAGGMSGAPLLAQSTQMITAARGLTKLPIIGVGGVMSAENAKQLLDSGANLLQVYTGLIYEGPHFVQKIMSFLR